MGKQYWCYRVDTSAIDFFAKELEKGRLRQGWGYDEGQDLRKAVNGKLEVDEGAGRNLPMLNVKKGDILLVPRLPTWEQVAIIQATEDWADGYTFSIPEKEGDYGHIFPAKTVRIFVRNNIHVSANIRSTLRTPSRFWSINQYAGDVEQILQQKDDDLREDITNEAKTDNAIEKAFKKCFNSEEFADALYIEMTDNFDAAQWEDALVHGLRCLMPNYQIERTGGPLEAFHGTDILVRMPGITGENNYAIAVQVKDYVGVIDGNSVLAQINKADGYWEDKENLKLIEKIIIITKAKRDDNPVLANNDFGVRVIFEDEFKKLLSLIGKSYLGLQNI